MTIVSVDFRRRLFKIEVAFGIEVEVDLVFLNLNFSKTHWQYLSVVQAAQAVPY